MAEEIVQESTDTAQAGSAGAAGAENVQEQNEPTKVNEPVNEPDGKSDAGNEPAAIDFSKINMPEGFGQLDDNFKALASEIGLSQEGTQKLVDYYTKDVVGGIVKAQEAQRDETIANWEKQATNEFGKEGLESARLAYQKLADPELKAFMDETGLGTNPAVIRVFAKIGKMMGEGRLVVGDAGGNDSAENRMFSKSIAAFNGRK